MIKQTIKEDYITEYINVNGYTSSSSKFAKGLNLSPEFNPEMRFILFNNLFLFLITVNTINKEEIEKISQSILFINLKRKFYNLKILGYENENFIFLSDDKTFTFNSDELMGYLKNYFGDDIGENVGTYKAINISQNDAFQGWTRNNLSKNCVVNDIDAFYFNLPDKFVILELKRINHESLLSWQPYTADYKNYDALEKIKEKYNVPYYVITYLNIEEQPQQLYYVALHLISDVKKTSIRGKRIVMERTALQNYPFGVNYM